MIAPAQLDRFSVVTIFDADSPAPAWERMFGWPSAGRDAVPLAIGSAGDRNIWAAKLDHVVQQADRAVLLVADGLGCAASAWWARLSPSDYVARIAGAVLFAPRDDEPDDLFASPRTRLPFPSLVIRDSGATAPLPARVEEWGSRLVTGHRERRRPAGSVAWREAQRLFMRLTHDVVEQDVARVAARFR